jgi:hypothetical protein
LKECHPLLAQLIASKLAQAPSLASFKTPLFPIVLVIVLFLQGCAVAQDKLIEEIISSAKPERFRPLDVTSIVLRYVPLGKERQAVISELTTQGFEVKEAEQKLEGCADCESLVVLGSYTKKATIPILPYESFISLRIGFKQGKAAVVSAWHAKNAY